MASKFFHCIVSYITMLLKIKRIIIFKEFIEQEYTRYTKHNNYWTFKSYLPTDLLIFNVGDVIAVP